jgi:hypothetical protein
MNEFLGREGIPSRVAFGAILIKETLGTTDRELVEMLQENVYLQSFLGLKVFQATPLFHPSMMVYFRNRFTPEFIQQVNEYICTGKWPEDKSSDAPPPPPENPKEENKGSLILDATAAPSDIRYPNDVSLLNDCRRIIEVFIELIWALVSRDGHKTPYNRKKAQQKFNNFIKRKRKSHRIIRAALNDQLEYLALAIERLKDLRAEVGFNPFDGIDWELFELICHIYAQQKEMYDNKTNSCEGKVLSLRQPHVRAILRNKAGAKFEYGQKLALSLVGGFVFIERQEWEPFNEGLTLKQAVYNYYNRFGCYPEAIMADKIYRNRANIEFCKKHGIRLSGPKLGRKTEGQVEEETIQAYVDSCTRNAVEGATGVLKRRFGLDLIMCYTAHNAFVEAQLNVLAMNLQRRLRILLSIFTNPAIFTRIRAVLGSLRVDIAA